MSAPAVFYYDLGDPASYLVAERINSALPAVPEWEPVHAATLGLTTVAPDRHALERRAAEAGLQTLRWPPCWPIDSHAAALGATYAKGIGRAVAFSLATFRQAFAGGRDPGDRDTVLIAGAACEIHPTALIRALETRSVQGALAAACARARGAEIHALPAIQFDGRLLQGEDCLEQALAAMR